MEAPLTYAWFYLWIGLRRGCSFRLSVDVGQSGPLRNSSTSESLVPLGRSTSWAELESKEGNNLNTQIEPVTVGALLALAVVGDLVNVAITDARIREARGSLDKLRSTSQILLDERADLCVSARSLAFQSSILTAQSLIFLETTSKILPKTAYQLKSAVLPSKRFAAQADRSWTPQKAAKSSDAVLRRHSLLVSELRRQQEKSVQNLCLGLGQGDDQRQLEKETQVAGELVKLHDKLMDDWTNLMFDAFDYTLFDPTFTSLLPKKGTGLMVANIILGGGTEGTLALFEDETMRVLADMTSNNTAPLWILRVLNGISHFLDSGILNTQTHPEVCTYSVRAAIVTAHGLITGTLKTAIQSQDTYTKFKLFFSVADSSFWLIRDVYRCIYGAGQVVPYPIVGVFAILKNIRVMFDIGENLYGLRRQSDDHAKMLDISAVEAAQQQLEYRFSACTSFVRAESLARQQQDILGSFQYLLEALPSKLAPQGAFAPATDRKSHSIVHDVFVGAPQLCYQALLGPKSLLSISHASANRGDEEKSTLQLLPQFLGDGTLSDVREAALWGPITDLAVSEDEKHDAAYESLGFFQPVLKWRLWACRGCSDKRILHMRVCHGTGIVSCLEQEKQLAKERFMATGEEGKPSIHIFTLPNAVREVEETYATLYRLGAVRPRILFVAAPARSIKSGTSVLTDMHWVRTSVNVPAPQTPGNHQAAYLKLVAEQNERVRQHTLIGEVLRHDVNQRSDLLTSSVSQGPRVDVLWKDTAHLHADLKESATEQLRIYKASLLGAFTTSGETVHAVDVGTASYQPEFNSGAKRHSFTRLLVTQGHLCHLYKALRLQPGIRRVRTPGQVFDESTYNKREPFREGWLVDESVWNSDGARSGNCIGYNALKQAIAQESGSFILKHWLKSWKNVGQELPSMRCRISGVVDLLTGAQMHEPCTERDPNIGNMRARVEDAAICMGACPPSQVLNSQDQVWERVLKLRQMEIWARYATSGSAQDKVFQIQRPTPAFTRDALVDSSRAIADRFSNFRAVLATSLCSKDQCHFRQNTNLREMLKLSEVQKKGVVSYVSSFWDETHTYGAVLAGNDSFENFPALGFPHRRRASTCAGIDGFLKKWVENHHLNLTTLQDISEHDLKAMSEEKHVKVHRAAAIEKTPIFFTGGLSINRPHVGAWLDVKQEVLRSSGMLKVCQVHTPQDKANIKSFMEALYVATKAAGEGECGFELLMPIKVEVTCNEDEGLSVDMHPDGVIHERCSSLTSRPSIDQYLVWISLRRVGKDSEAKRAELEHTVISQWGFTRHSPHDRQPRGCVVPSVSDLWSANQDTIEDDGTRYVFRQEVYSRLDPRLDEHALGTTQEGMCELQNELQVKG